MLKTLFVKNYILIENLEFDIEKGFNVILGETGAGKSIFLTALLLLSGSKLSGQVIGPFSDETVIEGVFEFNQNTEISSKLTELGFDSNDEFIFTRTLTKQGKSTYRINRQLVPLSIVKELLEDEIDIHSQHNSQFLKQNQFHRQILDRMIDPLLIEEVKNAYLERQKLIDKQKELIENNVTDYDLEELKEKISYYTSLNFSLENYLETKDQLELSNYLIQNQASYQKVIDELETLKFESLYSLFNENVDEKIIQMLQDAYYNLSEALSLSKRSLEEQNPISIDALNERLFYYQSEMRKNKCLSIEALLEKINNFSRKLTELENDLALKESIESLIIEKDKVFKEISLKLREERIKVAKTLEDFIHEHADLLHLKNCQFKVLFTDKESKYGLDEIRFMVSLNAGHPLIDISKSGSGGELSRFMLLLKSFFAKVHSPSLMIFDEIDTGVSGTIAKSMGELMTKLSKHSNLITVTHLPVVACQADRAYLVEKSLRNNDTFVQISKLNEDKFIEILAEMLAGDKSDVSLKLAKKLRDEYVV